MSERHDDVQGLVERAAAKALGKKSTKVRQVWTGDFAAEVGAGEGPALAAALERAPKSWSVGIASGDNWVAVTGDYAAKGANSNDADKLLASAAKKAGVTIIETAVNVHGVTIVGDEPSDG